MPFFFSVRYFSYSLLKSVKEACFFDSMESRFFSINISLTFPTTRRSRSVMVSPRFTHHNISRAVERLLTATLSSSIFLCKHRGLYIHAPQVKQLWQDLLDTEYFELIHPFIWAVILLISRKSYDAITFFRQKKRFYLAFFRR